MIGRAFSRRACRRRTGFPAGIALCTVLSCIALLGYGAPQTDASKISRAAARRCQAKIDRLLAYAGSAKPEGGQTTQFTDDEVNSYLALETSASYHPSLKSLWFTFQESTLGCAASIDFDQIQLSSSQVLNQLLYSMFSGVHLLSLSGTLVAQEGQAYFRLAGASFDGTKLPNALVEQIITIVGRSQRPPFDPLKPSEMPYGIKKVEVHTRSITVFQ